MKSKIRIGVIADDFTGASDAASFLASHGAKTVLANGVPKEFKEECDCLVVAVKSRSCSVEEALSQIKPVLDYFDDVGVQQIYFKYCSTFDSTHQGNIGPVMDYLLERYHQRYSILCPSLPVNGRIVKNGVLYVNGIPLDESPMKDHPINPMWDSRIQILMKSQSKYPSYVVGNHYEDETINDNHFYLIPDYECENDALEICKKYGSLKILSGGSGLLEYLAPSNKSDEAKNLKNTANVKSIILCGSCSKQTRIQVDTWINNGGEAYPIDAESIINNAAKIEDLKKQIVNSETGPLMFYTSALYGGLKKRDEQFMKCSETIEGTIAELAKTAYENGFNKIIVAGGETSGAVMIALDNDEFVIGPSVAPGVPILIPVKDQSIRFILKSGNFGQEDFFRRAVNCG